ncbi:DUF1559 domain-containing protein [Tautonia sociabilis]|nr:DUF1559 domain-containing protein [Tautonia sociabilis]
MKARRAGGIGGVAGGLSLVECLVVVTILGLLAALIIPAVQAAREAARRLGCGNNLRQLGIALNQYAGVFGSYPIDGEHPRSSIHVALLPFLDQGPLAETLADQATAVVPQLSSFLCPSDAVPLAEPGVTWTSYAGNHGVGVQRHGYNGIYGLAGGRPVGPGSVTDGLSSTIALSEWCLGDTTPEARDPKRTLFHTPVRLDRPEDLDRFAEACRGIDTKTARVNHHAKGLDWTWSEFGHTFYNHTLSPNQPSCLNGTGYQIGAWTAGSMHPGGVNCAFADGHVRLVKDTIDVLTWRALGSRDGGETDHPAGR